MRRFRYHINYNIIYQFLIDIRKHRKKLNKCIIQ